MRSRVNVSLAAVIGLAVADGMTLVIFGLSGGLSKDPSYMGGVWAFNPLVFAAVFAATAAAVPDRTRAFVWGICCSFAIPPFMAILMAMPFVGSDRDEQAIVRVGLSYVLKAIQAAAAAVVLARVALELLGKWPETTPRGNRVEKLPEFFDQLPKPSVPQKTGHPTAGLHVN